LTEEEKEKVKEYINAIESTGIILAGTLYDTEDEIFSEAVILKKSGEVRHIPRGSPSITHRLLYAILQHPRLKESLTFNSNLKLKISPSFGSALQKSEKLGAFVYKEAGREHYGHTFSLIFCDLIGINYGIWSSTISHYTPNTLNILLDEWQKSLKDKENIEEAEALREYIDCILRMLSFYGIIDDIRWKKIVENHLLKVIQNFLNFSKNKSMLCENVILQPYKVYIIAEAYDQGVNLSFNKDIDITSFYDEFKGHLNENGVIEINGETDYEGTLAMLCSCVILTGKNPLFGIFKEMRNFMEHFRKMDISKFYEIGFHTFSYKFMGTQVKPFEENHGKENISYLPASIPSYLLRLATLLRRKYDLEDVSVPFEKSIEKIFLVRKR
jgi:hypothetical protein